MAYCQIYDVAIIGGGIAGLSVALRLPEHMRIALFTTPFSRHIDCRCRPL